MNRLFAIVITASLAADPALAALCPNASSLSLEGFTASGLLFQQEAVTAPVVASQTPPLGAPSIGVALHKLPAELLFDQEDYRIEVLADGQTWRLTDKKNGSYFDVIPAKGNNVVAFAANINGTLRQILDPRGNPILYPYANRIEDGTYFWNGESHDLKTLPSAKKDANGHIYHGLARSKPWKIEATGIDEQGIYITSAFDHRDDLDMLRDFGSGKITVTYHLKGNRLIIDPPIKSKSRGAVLMSLAFHPWFILPEDPTERAKVRVQLPWTHRWKTRPDLIPFRQRPVHVTGKYDMQKPTPLGSNTYDDVFTGAKPDRDGFTTSTVDIPAFGTRIQVRASQEFKHTVLYAPGNESVLCIEPQTSATDAFNLYRLGISQATPLFMRSGRPFNGQMIIEASALPPEALESPPVGVLDLGSIVREQVAALKPLEDLFGVSIDYHLPKQPLMIEDRDPRIVQDGGNLESTQVLKDRILLEVLVNALKYSKRGQRVTVSLEKQRDEAVLTISDQGIGIFKKEMSRIGNFNFRGKNARDWIGGAGVGLFFAKEALIHHYHGRMKIESKINKGTTVTLRIPIGRSPASTPSAAWRLLKHLQMPILFLLVGMSAVAELHTGAKNIVQEAGLAPEIIGDMVRLAIAFGFLGFALFLKFFYSDQFHAKTRQFLKKFVPDDIELTLGMYHFNRAPTEIAQRQLRQWQEVLLAAYPWTPAIIEKIKGAEVYVVRNLSQNQVISNLHGYQPKIFINANAFERMSLPEQAYKIAYLLALPLAAEALSAAEKLEPIEVENVNTQARALAHMAGELAMTLMGPDAYSSRILIHLNAFATKLLAIHTSMNAARRAS